MNDLDWLLIINSNNRTITISKSDSNKFGELLESLPPPITIQIIKKEAQIQIEYKSKTFIWSPPKSTTEDDDEWEDNYNSLINTINTKYKLQENDYELMNEDECEITCGEDLRYVWQLDDDDKNEIYIPKISVMVTDEKTDVPDEEKRSPVDIKIFQCSVDVAYYKCDRSNANNDPIKGCEAVNRLVEALKYYSSLEIMNNKNHQNKFTAFIGRIYKKFLDDYYHLIEQHDNLEQISDALTASKSCNESSCSFTFRHYADANTIKKLDDETLEFYKTEFDQLHYHLFHLFDAGLRTRTLSQRPQRNSKAARRRFENSNKFNISGSGIEDKSGGFIDELYAHLSRSKIKTSVINKLAAYIDCEQYDTDSLKMEFYYECNNIAMNMQNTELIHKIGEFLKATSIRSSSFSIGQIFYYWSKYQHMEEWDQNKIKCNINNHGGHTIAELFVPKKWETFKEEVANYKYFSMVQYKDLVVKINEYMKSEIVSTIKAMQGSVKLEYGIKDGQPITFQHLLSIVLYTDYSELCTDFSRSFRGTHAFEPLSSIKKRNSNYWWMSKLLREAVQLFGYKKEKKQDESGKWTHVGLHGPFYSGLGIKIVFPAFEIRLCSPTSTSKQIEVATKFAGRNGIVVQLNNNVGYDVHDLSISAFPCYLFSRYKGEDEYLFLGGHYRLRIESVRIINGKEGKCQNFEEFFMAFSKFGTVLDAGFVKPNEINKKEKQIISACLNNKMDKFDNYIVSTWTLFRLNRTQIVLNLSMLCDDDYMDKELREMIMYGMRMTKDYKEVTDKTNLFGKHLFKVFTNIENITMFTTNNTGDPAYQCSLSFLWLLREIERETFNKIEIYGTHEYDTRMEGQHKNHSWIQSAWMEQKNTLIQKYSEKNLKIELKNTKGKDNRKQDCIVIKKI
eukprot:502287_1